MKKIKKILTVVISLTLVIALFIGLTRLVMPKYDGVGEWPLEGNFTAEYYQETTKHDVIMVGDCEVYENFDPICLWENYGITSYIRGNAQQLAWQSYAMLEDTFRYEKPKVVIYNVQALQHAKPQKETYNRMTFDGMKWSKTKWDGIKASLCKEENMLDYVFPLLRYHGRITLLSEADLTYYFTPKKVTHNGYYMRIDTLGYQEESEAQEDDYGEWLFGPKQENTSSETEDDEIDDPWAQIDERLDDMEEFDDEIDDPWAEIDERLDQQEAESEPASDLEDTDTDSSQGYDTKDRTFDSYPMSYLDKITKLCKDNDVTLILVKAPSVSPRWYDEENQQIVDYAKKHQLTYINFYELIDEIGLDYETDTYDGGLHMNLRGAGKLSKYLGDLLTTRYGVADHRGEAEYDSVYEKKYKAYQDMIEAQQNELDQYGEIVSY